MLMGEDDVVMEVEVQVGREIQGVQYEGFDEHLWVNQYRSFPTLKKFSLRRENDVLKGVRSK